MEQWSNGATNFCHVVDFGATYVRVQLCVDGPDVQVVAMRTWGTDIMVCIKEEAVGEDSDAR
jgi:hypothetical protein